MAPVSLEAKARYAPLIVVVSHFAAVVYLTCVISIGLHRSYTGLGPAQDTRLRINKRRKTAIVFAFLALLSLLTAAYHAANYLILSYKVWASERDVVLPSSLSASTSRETNGTGVVSPLYIRLWLTDTPIYRDAAEIVAERARRFWWANQRGLATTSWSMLLAIEGHRRKIPFLWAYLLLAHLVNLSFAQNLFYLSLLLTPSPLESGMLSSRPRLSRFLAKVFPPKPNNWCPNPALFLGLLVLNYASLSLLPVVAGGALFPLVAGATILFTFSIAILPAIVPESWGTVHAHPHDAYSTFTALFRYVSLASIALHGKASVSGLFYSLPRSHEHRHSILMPFATEERSNWERTTTAVGKILGSVSDHPVVAAVGSDVLLSAISLGLWAAVRAINVDDILVSSVPYYKSEPASAFIPKDLATSEKETPDDDEDLKHELEEPTTVRRRGRPRKSVLPSITVSSDRDGDVTTPEPTPRKRGRPRKAKADPDGGAADEAYTPSPSVAESVIEGDEVSTEDDWEAASLAWGLTALGGLGTGSAGVFGAETISR